MAIDWDALNFDDKPALLKQLRVAYYKLVAGEAEEEIEGTDRRRVRFMKADMPRLQSLIRQLEADIAAETAALTGAPVKRRRFALVGRMR